MRCKPKHTKLDDLMDTLQAANPRAYSSVMRKIQNLG